MIKFNFFIFQINRFTLVLVTISLLFYFGATQTVHDYKLNYEVLKRIGKLIERNKFATKIGRLI